LLKTAITVVEMREILKQVESQHSVLLNYPPKVLSLQAMNAEEYARQGAAGLRAAVGELNVGGEDIKTISAVSFIKSCLDISQTQSSLLLSAKALLAARLALNILPKVSRVIRFLTGGASYVL
jgi:hypothetical protein